MGGVGGRRGQHELGVGGQLDLAHPGPWLVSDTRRTSASSSGETTTSSVRRDRRRRGGRTPRGPRRSRLVAVRARRRSAGTRPTRPPALHIAQEDEGPPAVAGRILPPAGDGHVARSGCSPSPRRSASPRSGRCQECGCAASAWCGEVNRRTTGATKPRTGAAPATSSARGRATATSRGAAPGAAARSPGRSARAWKRAGMAPSLQDVGQGEERHPLVMRHVGAHDAAVCPSGSRVACSRAPRRTIRPAAAARSLSRVVAAGAPAGRTGSTRRSTTRGPGFPRMPGRRRPRLHGPSPGDDARRARERPPRRGDARRGFTRSASCRRRSCCCRSGHRRTWPWRARGSRRCGRPPHVRDFVEPAFRRFTSPHDPMPRTHLLSNGRYAVMLTAAGSGYSRCDGLAVTRWREDPTRDPWGTYVFLRDAESGTVWSAGYQPVGRRRRTRTARPSSRTAPSSTGGTARSRRPSR